MGNWFPIWFGNPSVVSFGNGLRPWFHIVSQPRWIQWQMARRMPKWSKMNSVARKMTLTVQSQTRCRLLEKSPKPERSKGTLCCAWDYESTSVWIGTGKIEIRRRCKFLPWSNSNEYFEGFPRPPAHGQVPEGREGRQISDRSTKGHIERCRSRRRLDSYLRCRK